MRSSIASRDSSTPTHDSGQGELSRTAVSGTVKLMTAQAFTLVCGYVVAVTLARGLGPEDYGVYGLILSVLLATELIGRLGIPQAASKLIASAEGDSLPIERSAMSFSAAVYLTIFAGFSLCAPFFAWAFRVPEGTSLFLLAGLDIPFYGMFFMGQHVLNGRRRFGAEGFGIGLYGLAKALGVLSLLYLGMSVRAALIVNLLASVVALAYVVARLPKGSLRLDLSQIRPIWRMALPIAFFVLGAQVLDNLDLWSLKWFGRDLAEDTVGHYVAATNIARLPGVVHFVMAAVLVPTVAKAASLGTEAVASLVRGATRFLVVLLVPVCAYLALRSAPLMLLVYSEEYLDGAIYQAILVLRFGLLSTLLMTYCSVLIALDAPREAARQVLRLVPLGLLLCALMVRWKGAEGAALAAVLTVACGVLTSIWSLRGRAGLVPPVTTILRSCASTVLLAILLSLYSPPVLLLPLELVVFLGLHLGLLMLVGELKPDELRRLVRRSGGGS